MQPLCQLYNLRRRFLQGPSIPFDHIAKTYFTYFFTTQRPDNDFSSFPKFLFINREVHIRSFLAFQPAFLQRFKIYYPVDTTLGLTGIQLLEKYKENFDVSLPDQGQGLSIETSKFSLYFSGSCIPINPKLSCYYWHYLYTIHWQTVQDYIQWTALSAAFVNPVAPVY
jgi:hypothetical protein